MPRDKLTFRQRDLNAALKVVQARGLNVARIEVRQDGVVIIPGDPATAATDPDDDAETLRTKEALRHAAEKARTS
jgi:hypothetical protein